MKTNTTKLTPADIEDAAKILGTTPAALKAVIDVESSGGGFLPDGRVKVNYEPHIMYRRLRDKFNVARAEAERAKHPDLVARGSGHRLGPNAEDRDMDRATLIDRQCALESASWGMFQIMGYHWKTLGMRGIQDFVNLMYRGERGHLEAFVRFIQADPALALALRRHDWNTFARIYNGPNYAAHGYHTKMEAAHKAAINAQGRK